MKSVYSITDIEAAINYWTARQVADDVYALCPSARVLADVYGEMIYRRQVAIEAHRFTPAQASALAMALHQAELPLQT